jgi:hypothetical protein
MKKLNFRPSPAMIVACVALFVALGGTGLAATYVVSSNSQIGPGTVSGHSPPTGKHANIIGGSVNGSDLATGAVTQGKLGANSVNSAKVVDGSLVAGDTDTSSIQQRLDGGCAAGQSIQSVDQSGASTCTAVGFTQVTSVSNAMTPSGASSPGQTYTNSVQCPTGTTLIGGGGRVDTSGGSFGEGVQSSWPDPATRTWTITVATTFTTLPQPTSTAYAICASP